MDGIVRAENKNMWQKFAKFELIAHLANELADAELAVEVVPSSMHGKPRIYVNKCVIYLDEDRFVIKPGFDMLVNWETDSEEFSLSNPNVFEQIIEYFYENK